MSRPTKDADSVKTNRIYVRASEPDIAFLQRIADSHHVPLAVLVHKLAMQAAQQQYGRKASVQTGYARRYTDWSR